MVDHGTDPVQAAAQHVRGHVAGDDEAVAAQAADHRGDDVVTRAQDEELVIAFQAVDLRGLLDTVELDVQPRPEDAVGRDDERIVLLGADGHHGVEAGAPIDADGRVDVVFELVVAATALGDDVAFGDECADHEVVVARLAFHAYHGLVAVHVERVVILAAVGSERVAGTTAQPAAADLQQGDVVAARGEVDVGDIVGDHTRIVRTRRIGIVEAVRVGAEHLSDLEQVLAATAVQRGDGAVVVDVELVVAVRGADRETPVDGAVVVDALHGGREGRLALGIGADRREQRNEMLAQQEHVARGRAVDGQGLGPVIRRPGVMHVDQVARAAAGHVHQVGIRAATTVQVDGVAHGLRTGQRMMVRAVVQRVHRGQAVEDDRVPTTGQPVGVAQDLRPAAQCLRMQVDDVVLTLPGDQVGHRVERPEDVDARAGA